MEVPQKLKTELPYNTAIPLLGIYPKSIWDVSQVTIKTLHTHVYCSTIHNSQAREAAMMPHN
jgi:hypothetical protein